MQIRSPETANIHQTLKKLIKIMYELFQSLIALSSNSSNILGFKNSCLHHLKQRWVVFNQISTNWRERSQRA